ncbi:MAG: FAD-binding oxidoreductase [bacterium]|nr:FAD-binding oxidoreductase [bacterium]MDE0287060.1 FAD-binding oxidoreductase [bacterium]MDE0440191.1 FAD-binding oxidoreductase [bacterium]
MANRLKYWGWGYEGHGLSTSDRDALLHTLATVYGVTATGTGAVPALDGIALPPGRLDPPASLDSICTQEPYERALHSFGQSQPDSIRLFASDFGHAPDVIAYPRNDADVAALLDWAGEEGAALIPFGGGSSVVGGVTPDVADGFAGVVTMDMSRMNRVLEVDTLSRAARIQGGARGPQLEAALKPHGVTLRHFPQSFQHSTLGGWIATRSGGHFATLYTHIDDLVENVTMVTPAGRMESRRLPGSGAGPSPDRLVIGSEGSLGIITEAWVRVQGRVRFKATAGFRFPDFLQAAGAVRAIAQAGLFPANVRIVDGVELAVNGAGDGSFTLMVVSFESADRPVDTWMDLAEECALSHGGVTDTDWRTDPQAHLTGAAGAWREAFIRMPYNREVLTPLGIISDTFESAITWDRFESFYHDIRQATHDAIRESTGREGAVSCRFSHAYPDGPAPYFAFHCAADPASMLDQWWEIKRAVSDAVLDSGGTITHHHAIGRDHQPWYERQRPPLFGDVLARAKTHLDPQGILNPGVLVRADGHHSSS